MYLKEDFSALKDIDVEKVLKDVNLSKLFENNVSFENIL
jgi:hypothetical protein